MKLLSALQLMMSVHAEACLVWLSSFPLRLLDRFAADNQMLSVAAALNTSSAGNLDDSTNRLDIPSSFCLSRCIHLSDLFVCGLSIRSAYSRWCSIFCCVRNNIGSIGRLLSRISMSLVRVVASPVLRRFPRAFARHP